MQVQTLDNLFAKGVLSDAVTYLENMPRGYIPGRQELIDALKKRQQEMEAAAELFKVFGDSTRIRILFVLFEAEVCVCDLAKALNMTQSAISHQLRILKQNKLVKSRRDGKSIFYSLADEHVRTIIDQGREHIEED